MVSEVEIKARIDLASITPKLDELGVEFLDIVEIKDTYFDRDSTLFLNKTTLRIREEDGRPTYVTYKSPSSVPYTRFEINTPVLEDEPIFEKLESVGMKPIGVVEKKRTEFICGDCVTICLDEVKDLGDFMELEIIESNFDHGKIEGNYHLLLSILSVLGVGTDQQVSKSYIDLLLNR